MSYKPEGKVSLLEELGGMDSMKNLRRFAECMAFNNESMIRADPEDNKKVERTGLPTEAALRVLTEKFRKYDSSFNQ